jgi:phenylalanyl-tRNA synthetase beta chain
MKISLDWLREYVKVEIPVPELVDRLTMIGLVVESVEEKGEDVVLDVETYANRPDTLGHLGIAREVAVLLGEKLVDKPWPVEELAVETSAAASIQVFDEALCPRYCGILVKGVEIGPSPAWLASRIEAMGLRSINNIVDVTNYVLFATAQPIHSFDFGKLSGGRIVVRRARKGETLRSLDGRLIELSPEMLVIADAERPIALAGVMGGEETGISGSTRDVFIESACFDPMAVRLAAKKTGLTTDASYRFERGTDIEGLPRAALMAASLLCGFGGQATRGLLDVYPKPRKCKAVVLRHRRIAGLLGVDVPVERVERILADLGFGVGEFQNDVWHIEPPSFRVDIEREADLIEEIARFFGYSNIPSHVTPLTTFDAPPTGRKRERILKLRQTLLQQGFDEVLNFGFSDPEKEALAASGRTPVAIRNPISSKAATLRTNLVLGLAENVSWNLNRGLEGVHIFEVGNVHYCVDEAPCEMATLGIMTAGKMGTPHWQGRREDTDFFVLKGAVEALMTALRYEPCTFEEAGHPFFEPGGSLALVYKGETVGHLGILTKTLRGLAAIDGPVYAAQIDLGVLMEKQPKPFQFTPVPKFPAMIRDLSFLVDREVTYREIQGVVARLSIPILEGFDLTDRFSGPSIPGDKVSLSIRFRYRNPKRTLLAEDVDRAEQDVIGHLKSALNIQLREGGKIDNRNRPD